MLNNPAIQIVSLEKVLEDDKVVIKIVLRNTADRTVYAYGRPRRIFYDKVSSKLTLYLHDHRPDDEQELAPHLREPDFVQLEAGVDTILKVKLQPLIQRMRSAAERGTGPIFEELPIADAKEIVVEIAHQDTPFYYNPKENNLKQLNAWGKTLVKADVKLKIEKPPKKESK